MAQAARGERPAGHTLLAFDFGSKRIGVAVGDFELRMAHALTTIAAEAGAERFAQITRLIEEWRPARLVVGEPRHPDGAAHEMTVRCRRFARQLEGRFGLPVALVDERWTSTAAESMLREAGRDPRSHKAQVDAQAAQLILQSYLDATS